MMNEDYKAILTPEIIEAFAEIQYDGGFEDFKEFAEQMTDLLLDDHLFSNDDADDLKRRVSLVRDVRYYAECIQRLFPGNINNDGKL